MHQRFLTLLVVRHARPRFRKLRLSYSFATIAAAVGAVLAAAALLAPGLVLRLRSQSIELDRLRQANTRLIGENGQLGSTLQQVQRRLTAFEAQAMQIARELDLPPFPGVGTGAGGGGSAPASFPLQGDLESLHARSEALGQIDEMFRARIGALRATPDGMPADGWFSHGYGWRKDPWSGEREFHRGIDIVAPDGSDVRATADGVVSDVGRYADYGRSIDVDHGQGFATRYAHLSAVLVRSGDRVARGERIGTVGATGRTTGPHLHYEVFRDGRRTNPWTYLGQIGD